MSRLILERVGRVPAIELRAQSGGAIELRYLVENDNYPGFDGEWRVMSESEQREHLRLGGKVAEWLLTLQHVQEG